ncbi:MAG TPA: M3 family metallopeptidase, partial [Anaerolineales bacterium]|nr:M3 family metallopeptidase [Anaerolineales bacterium]
MAIPIPPRSKVNKKYTWNAESVFKTKKDWETEAQNILADLPNIKKYEGRLGESSETLVEAFDYVEKLMKRLLYILVYAGFSYNVDTTNQSSAAMYSKAQSIYGQVAGTIAFINPELLQMGKAKLDDWMSQNAKLAIQAHNMDNLFRRQAHVRSGEVEEVLGMVSDPLGGAGNSSSMLTNADFKFAPALDSKGKKVMVTQGNIHTSLMEHADRKVRRNAFESYMDKHLEFKNTLAINLASSIKANVFYSQVRRHENSLSASLFENNIPVDVFHNLINTFKKNLPVWHRYFEIRRKALKLKEITYYDMWAPIAKKKTKVPFEKAVDLICDSLAPL